MPTANEINGRAGKQPTLTPQVTKRITIVPAETWVLPCSWLPDPQSSLSKTLQRLENWRQTCTDHNRKLGFFPHFFTTVRSESAPQKAAMRSKRSPLPISPTLSLPSQLLHVLSRAFSTPQLPTVLLHSHSTVVSKTPGLKTRKQKPGGWEVAVQLVWRVGTQNTVSFFVLQPEAFPRPYALFTNSCKQKRSASCKQAGQAYKSLSL